MTKQEQRQRRMIRLVMSEIGRKGGKVKSKRKTLACRANGRKHTPHTKALDTKQANRLVSAVEGADD